MALQGTSNAPMILGIIGGILGIPAAVCSSACHAAISDFGSRSSSGSDSLEKYLIFFLITAIGGMIAGILSKRNPIPTGIIMILCGSVHIFSLAFFVNMFGLAVFILLVLGGILSLTQKKVEAPNQ